MKAAEFYDVMSVSYHLIGSDWDTVMISQGTLIDSILTQRLNVAGQLSILDCSCGIGTQALGLARLGYQVTATDVSPGAIEQARKNAQRLSLNCHFAVDDMRNLSSVDGKFNGVISFDNSIAHLHEDQDLLLAFAAIKSHLTTDGIFLFSVRNYDDLSVSRPNGTLPRHIKDQAGERVYVQTWVWSEDGMFYDLNLFILKNEGALWQAAPLRTRLRAYRRIELETLLKAGGFETVEYLSPKETGFYQPIIAAR